MKLTHTLITSALCWSTRISAAATAHVYLYDPDSEQATDNAISRTLSPVQARVVFAQRAGLEDYHSADLYDEDVIEAINAFGVKRSLFGRQEDTNRVFILAAGVEEPETIIPSSPSFADFLISPSPSANSTRDLFADLTQQSTAERSNGHARQHIHTEGWLGTRDAEGLSHVLETFSWTDTSLTIIFSPSASPDTETSHTDNPWGTYTLPHTPSQLHKRQKREPTLSSASPLTNSTNSTSPLPGILPTCFTTLSHCTTSTRNCTSHGACALKYTDSSASKKSTYRQCYACMCTPTVVKDAEGRVRTTYWSGPACQKKDVSVQFWILALFSVGMVFVVSFAVGEVWGMGGEALPSVIGAGVGGPSARK